MTLIGTYRGQAVPLYGRLLIVDPVMSGSDEPDLQKAFAEAESKIIGGSRWRAAIKAGQDAAAIAVTIQVWDALPDDALDDGWTGPLSMTVEFPQGTLILENISSGPISLEPQSVERITLPMGAGAYDMRAWHRGREQAAAAVAELWEADEVGDDVHAAFAALDGMEKYLLQIWPHQR